MRGRMGGFPLVLVVSALLVLTTACGDNTGGGNSSNGTTGDTPTEAPAKAPSTSTPEPTEAPSTAISEPTAAAAATPEPTEETAPTPSSTATPEAEPTEESPDASEDGKAGPKGPEDGPYHAAPGGEPQPDVVVIVEQHNNPVFDLRPREVNGVGVADQFDEANENNMEEPLVIPPGRVRFFLDNRGTLAHNFQVRHPDGTNIKKTDNVAARRTGEMVIDLEPGEYLIACPVSDHDQRGMLRPLKVDPAAADFPEAPLWPQG